MALVSVGVAVFSSTDLAPILGCSTSMYSSLIGSLAFSADVSLISVNAPVVVVIVIVVVVIIVVVPGLSPLMAPISLFIAVITILVVDLTQFYLGMTKMGVHCIHAQDHSL